MPIFVAWQPAWWAAFGVTLAAALAGWLPGDWALLACGIAPIPALHGLVRGPIFARASWPLALGRYTMAIYLFNVIAIGVVKAALIALGVPWTGAGFAIHAPGLLLAGIALPMLAKRLVLRRVPILDRMTD